MQNTLDSSTFLADLQRLSNVGEIRTVIENMVAERLKSAGISIEELHRMIEQLQVNFKRTPNGWEKILRKPCQASDEEFQAAFCLEKKETKGKKQAKEKEQAHGEQQTQNEESTRNVRGSKKRPYSDLEDTAADAKQLERHRQTLRYYIRSFKMSRKEFRKMIHQWWKNHIIFDEMPYWDSAIDGLCDDDAVYLRYVGMTNREDVTVRHAEDLSRRKIGLLAALQMYLYHNLPKVLYEVTIMELHWLSDRSLQTIDQRDFFSRREQILISLLEPKLLFNQQLGGDRYQYFHDEGVHRGVSILSLNSCWCVTQCNLSATVPKELEAWRDDGFKIQEGVHNPYGTKPTRGFLREITKAATPLLVREFALCLLLMSDVLNPDDTKDELNENRIELTRTETAVCGSL